MCTKEESTYEVIPVANKGFWEGFLAASAVIGGAYLIAKWIERDGLDVVLYDCPHCKEGIEYGTHTCPQCMTTLIWNFEPDGEREG